MLQCGHEHLYARKKMKASAAEQNIDIEIEAFPLEKFNESIETYDLCLLGPQVRYKLEEFRKIAAEKNKKVEAINPIIQWITE